ncbi:MAG: hypothetical protein N3F63_00330 [Thermoplasmata archaeon]|nr:hypothetical protein [Thermoplasmata archaeon]
MSSAVKIILTTAVRLPVLLFRLLFWYLKLGHKRRWATYRFRKRLRKRGLPREIADKLAVEYEELVTLRSLKRFLI